MAAESNTTPAGNGAEPQRASTDDPSGLGRSPEANSAFGVSSSELCKPTNPFGVAVRFSHGAAETF